VVPPLFGSSAISAHAKPAYGGIRRDWLSPRRFPHASR